MFTAKNNLRQAIVVLPAAKAGRIKDTSLARWLSRSTLRDSATPREMFLRVMSALGEAPPQEGLAALRFWGQTRDRPNVWIAAVDLVHLEARMDDPCVHALGGAQSPQSDLRVLFDFLQRSLGEDSPYAFARIGQYGYLRGDQPIATATMSAALIDGLQPEDYMPSGEDAKTYLTLTSELQMCLHEHEVNLRREKEGFRPVNSVWFWGGGWAPEKTVKVLPPFIGEDPLFQGYWERCSAVIAPWPGNFAECLEFAVKDLVVLPPADNEDGELLEPYLDELRGLLKSGALDRLVLLFRDGLSARFGRFDAFRFWRRRSPLL